jgi:hypothetical protein
MKIEVEVDWREVVNDVMRLREDDNIDIAAKLKQYQTDYVKAVMTDEE